MNPAVLHKEVQEYINSHLGDDISRILLKKSPFRNVSSKELAQQLEGKRSAERKLPSWYNTPGIYFPPKISIEQSSSELTAAYKAELLKGTRLIDLTGGLGVDSYYFSKKAEEVIHCELNEELSAAAAHNARMLKAGNIRFINDDGLSFLKNTAESFDTIYIDPSRRVQRRKVFLLSSCEPDITSQLDLLFEKTRRIIVKASPILDIQSGLQELKNVSQVHVVSIKNDCKEVLFVMDKDFSGEAEIHCILMNGDKTSRFQFSLSEERNIKLDSYSLPLNYLYEPDAALLKAGCFKLPALRFGLEKTHPNTHLYTSEEKKEDFPGRIFKIQSSGSYKDFMKENKLSKANIISRNFPLSPDEIKKRHKIRDGGNDYLLFMTGTEGKLLCVWAERL